MNNKVEGVTPHWNWKAVVRYRSSTRKVQERNTWEDRNIISKGSHQRCIKYMDKNKGSLMPILIRAWYKSGASNSQPFLFAIRLLIRLKDLKPVKFLLSTQTKYGAAHYSRKHDNYIKTKDIIDMEYIFQM